MRIRKFRLNTTFTETQTCVAAGSEIYELWARTPEEAREKLEKDPEDFNALDATESSCEVTGRDVTAFRVVGVLPVEEGFDKTKEIRELDDVQGFFEHLLFDVGLNFHPDDDIEDSITEDGKPFFSPEDAAVYKKRMAECWEVASGRIYEIALDAMAEYHRETGKDLPKEREYFGWREANFDVHIGCTIAGPMGLTLPNGMNVLVDVDEKSVVAKITLRDLPYHGECVFLDDQTSINEVCRIAEMIRPPESWEKGE